MRFDMICEYTCKIGTSQPDRFINNPIHQMPGLNTYCLVCSSAHEKRLLLPDARARK